MSIEIPPRAATLGLSQRGVLKEMTMSQLTLSHPPSGTSSGKVLAPFKVKDLETLDGLIVASNVTSEQPGRSAKISIRLPSMARSEANCAIVIRQVIFVPRNGPKLTLGEAAPLV
jgi:hypothetical protein